MKKSVKAILAILLIVGVVFGGVFLFKKSKEGKNEKKYSVISTSFPGYDFAKAVAKNTDVSVRMLLKPGAESHTFEPTPQDIMAIKSSNLFLYVGGDSDEWVKKILNEIDPNKTKVLKLVDLVKTKEEELVEGMEEDHHEEDEDHHDKDHHEHDKKEAKDEKEAEVDEHVWTSLRNAKEITKKISAEIAKIDKDEKTKFEKNTKAYEEKLDDLDKRFSEMIKKAKRKEIIVGDRFPLRYFVDDYGLKYYAAFPGCSEQTEANAKTISFITKKVKEDKIPAIFKIELSKGLIAETIAKETGAKVYELHSAHNISERDFETGVTYADLMERNYSVLEKALND